MALRQRTVYNQYRGNVQTSAAGALAVSVAELETWLKIPSGDETANLTIILNAAISQIERYLGCCLITQSFQLSLDRWPMQQVSWWDGVQDGAISELESSGKASEIEIPRFPLQSIDAMSVDGSSVTTTDYFIVDTSQRYGRLVLKRGKTFPTLTSLSANGILITYTSGFGNASSDVPEDLRLAVLNLASFMFEHRGDGCSSEKAFVDSGAKSICNMYKVGRL